MLPGNKISASHLGKRFIHYRPVCGGNERSLGRYALQELLSLNQFPILCGSVALRIRDLAIGGDQMTTIHLPLRSRETNQHLTGGGSHLAQLQIHSRCCPASESAHVKGS